MSDFYNGCMMRGFAAVFIVATVVTVSVGPALGFHPSPDAAAANTNAQTPQPFPRAGTTQAQRPAAPPVPTVPAAPAPAPAAAQGADEANAPTAATLGVSPYPGSHFIASYDAGRGQRYYVFGTSAAFAEVVGYYRVQLDERGDLVFKDPATHMFTGGPLGRFREETMAFPPSVTVKDWTSGGSQGYPNPKLGAEPARFPTIVMIVPPPPGAPAR
jgi:hypothetical protein